MGARESPIKQKRLVSAGRLPSDESRELEGKSYEVCVSVYICKETQRKRGNERIRQIFAFW